MRRRRKAGLAATALAVAPGLAWGFWPQPVLVAGVAVARAPMTVTVEEEGRTRIKDRYVVSAPVAGFLRHMEGLLDGVVRTVEPAGFTKISALGVEEQRVWVIAGITSPRERWSRLGDAYRVEASFILWHEDKVLQLPTSALFRHGDAWAVFVLEDGRAVRRPVEIGQRSGLIAQIISGLSEGDVVITHPDDRIEDGVRVSVGGKS